ncbi:MAG: cytochrome-c peroxidase [Cytophagales bacterium CG12_big_fil_rev_8_21_14_0_65_40_12]|nr:MAG: cytochrome-c peroxidase [Cytophagales bacterium CG12_big_fil_rev_8_21_14_0_65_40_12]PIW05170.1 MAG: cytochrome-c peroxidase [Cytophagales bacterium CG17_big_fil_post_rev_8_21_14_2_50_40_13]
MEIRDQLIKYLAFGWVLFSLWSCQHVPEHQPDNSFTFVKPPHFPEATYTLDKNPITEQGVALGRKLFFDPILSRDNSVSCNNCHQQSRAFADSPLHPTSIGVDSKFGIRNAPSLANMAFLKEFFWDGGVTHLDFVPINAIESQVEMDEKLAHVVEKLNAREEYRQMFKLAFGIDEITSPYMLQALSQFTALMISADSKYDRYVLYGEALSANELRGLELFEQKCASCHSGELFSDQTYRNNGLSTVFGDEGRARITESSEDIGKFRVPSLRNAAITGPYMHDARFKTLLQVLDHYDGLMVGSSTLDPSFKNGNEVVGIPLTEEEKAKIIDFINTLTDYTFISDDRFRNHD